MLYEDLGFLNDPFAETNAEEENILKAYFVRPPYFKDILGNPKNPKSSAILAQRGGGKTAQRRTVEDWAVLNGVLAVTYTRFEFSGKKDLNEIGLTYHCGI